jgi:kynurenine formamidase
MENDGIIQLCYIQKMPKATWSLLAWKKNTKLAAQDQRQLTKSSYYFEQKITTGENAGTHRE